MYGILSRSRGLALEVTSEYMAGTFRLHSRRNPKLSNRIMMSLWWSIVSVVHGVSGGDLFGAHPRELPVDVIAVAPSWRIATSYRHPTSAPCCDCASYQIFAPRLGSDQEVLAAIVASQYGDGLGPVTPP
jgi:hypothetical protein